MEISSCCHLCPFFRFPRGNQVRYFPQPLSHTSGHRRSRAEGAMNLDKVVGEVSQGNGRDMVLDLFRKGISQSGKPARSHPHAEVMTFDIARVYVFGVGRSSNRVALTTKAHGGAVTLLSIVRDTVDLHQHRVVDIARKRLINRLDIKLQAIAGKLHAIRKTAGKVFDKVSGTLRIALANQPARYQLSVGIDRKSTRLKSSHLGNSHA